MLIGIKSQFAIEYEISYITDNAIYGAILFWAKDESIGNWDDIAMINGCAFWLCKFATELVNRYNLLLVGLSKEDIYYTLYDSFIYHSL